MIVGVAEDCQKSSHKGYEILLLICHLMLLTVFFVFPFFHCLFNSFKILSSFYVVIIVNPDANSLTDDAFTQQCEDVQTNTPSCRAFDITVQAWDLMVVFASNQGSMAGVPGEPAGLNGVVPIEYEEVDCNDAVVSAAIQSSHCGLPSQLMI